MHGAGQAVDEREQLRLRDKLEIPRLAHAAQRAAHERVAALGALLPLRQDEAHGIARLRFAAADVRMCDERREHEHRALPVGVRLPVDELEARAAAADEQLEAGVHMILRKRLLHAVLKERARRQKTLHRQAAHARAHRILPLLHAPPPRRAALSGRVFVIVAALSPRCQRGGRTRPARHCAKVWNLRRRNAKTALFCIARPGRVRYHVDRLRRGPQAS